MNDDDEYLAILEQAFPPEPKAPSPQADDEDDFLAMMREWHEANLERSGRAVVPAATRAATRQLDAEDLELFHPMGSNEATERMIQDLLRRLARQPISFQTLPGVREPGVYFIYYHGEIEFYDQLRVNPDGSGPPIYLGSANDVCKRLKEHRDSLEATLGIADFTYRFVPLSADWPAGLEEMLLNRLAPVWNKVVTGFGNHTPGANRTGQTLSAFETLHEPRFKDGRVQRATDERERLIERARLGCASSRLAYKRLMAGEFYTPIFSVG